MTLLGIWKNPVALPLSQSNALRQLLLSAHVDLTDDVLLVCEISGCVRKEK